MTFLSGCSVDGLGWPGPRLLLPHANWCVLQQGRDQEEDLGSLKSLESGAQSEMDKCGVEKTQAKGEEELHWSLNPSD